MDGASKHFGLMVLSTSAAVALTLAGCSAGVADVEPAASSAASSEAPASTQDFSEAALIDHSYLPGIYLPEHCEYVEPGATQVFEDLISELDADNCVAPYTSNIIMGGVEWSPVRRRGQMSTVCPSTCVFIDYWIESQRSVSLVSGVSG